MSESKKNARGLEIEVNADTDKMVKKLKAIAKHAEALANELKKIDGSCNCVVGDAVCKSCYEKIMKGHKE